MERPNIVLLVLDTFRHDHLWRSVAGGPLCPRLGELAEQAVSFENAISPAPHTCPVHASFFTGLLPVEHGLYTPQQALGGRLPVPSLVKRLREAGYVCMAFSANPFIGHGTALGRDFDLVIGGLHGTVALPRPGAMRRLARGVRNRLWPGRLRAQKADQVEKMVAGIAAALRAGAAATPGKPVFVFCNLMVAHDPRVFTPADAAYTRPPGLRGAALQPRRYHDDCMLDQLGVRPLPPTELGQLRWSYAASVHCADRLVGRFIEAVDGELDPGRTDLIVVSDHGELLGEYGFFEHNGFLYEPLVHVALIVRSEALPAGIRCDRLVQSHWLWSFVVERAGLGGDTDRPAGQGSLSAALEPGAVETPAFSFSDPAGTFVRLERSLGVAMQRGVDASRVDPKPLDPHVQAVRLGDRSLIVTCAGGRKAFSTAEGLERELSGPELDQARRELGAHVMAIDRPARVAEPGGAVGEDVLRRLRELGYAE